MREINPHLRSQGLSGVNRPATSKVDKTTEKPKNQGTSVPSDQVSTGVRGPYTDDMRTMVEDMRRTGVIPDKTEPSETTPRQETAQKTPRSIEMEEMVAAIKATENGAVLATDYMGQIIQANEAGAGSSVPRTLMMMDAGHGLLGAGGIETTPVGTVEVKVDGKAGPADMFGNVKLELDPGLTDADAKKLGDHGHGHGHHNHAQHEALTGGYVGVAGAKSHITHAGHHAAEHASHAAGHAGSHTAGHAGEAMAHGATVKSEAVTHSAAGLADADLADAEVLSEGVGTLSQKISNVGDSLTTQPHPPVVEHGGQVAGEATKEAGHVKDALHGAEKTTSILTETMLGALGGVSAFIAYKVTKLGVKQLKHGLKETEGQGLKAKAMNEEVLEGTGSIVLGVKSGAAGLALVGKMAALKGTALAVAGKAAYAALPVLGVAHGAIDTFVGGKQMVEAVKEKDLNKGTKGFLNAGMGISLATAAVTGGVPALLVAGGFLALKVGHRVLGARKERKAAEAAAQAQQQQPQLPAAEDASVKKS